MFSLAILSIMVAIVMKMMKAITAAFAAKYLATFAGIGSTDGINSVALQQGGVGLLLSTLIVMAPPMAAAFFQGTLGQFASYSSFGNVGSQLGGQDQAAIAQGRQAAMSAGYTPPANQSTTAIERGHAPSRDTANTFAQAPNNLVNSDTVKPGNSNPRGDTWT